jgi:hypothetical protein
MNVTTTVRREAVLARRTGFIADSSEITALAVV